MSNINLNDCSNLRNQNVFDTDNGKQDRTLSVDSAILLALSCVASAEWKEQTLLYIAEIKTKLASIDKDIQGGNHHDHDEEIVKYSSLKQSTNIPKRLTYVKKYQRKLTETDVSLSFPKSNGTSKGILHSLKLSCLNMENGMYTVMQTTKELELAKREVRTAESTKTFPRLPQHLIDHMRDDTPVFEPYVVDAPKQSIVVKNRKMTRRLKPGLPVPQLGRALQKKIITASTRKASVGK